MLSALLFLVHCIDCLTQMHTILLIHGESLTTTFITQWMSRVPKNIGIGDELVEFPFSFL